jgi:hypothetical protein
MPTKHVHDSCKKNAYRRRSVICGELVRNYCQTAPSHFPTFASNAYMLGGSFLATMEPLGFLSWNRRGA